MRNLNISIVYVIDIGTNSIRLMEAKIQGDHIESNYKLLRTVRTGEKVYETKMLSKAAMNRSIAALREYREIIKDHPVFCFATSAVREALNKQVFLSNVKQQVGFDIEVLSGEQEAACGFLGAIGFHGKGGIVDIGGGSTEMIYGKAEDMLYSHSFDIGCVRALDLFGPDAKYLQVYDWAVSILQKAPFSSFTDFDLYAIGGTATAAAAIDLKLSVYDPKKVNHYRLSKGSLMKMCETLFSMPQKERRNVMGLEENRADIIIFGLAILSAVLDLANKETVIISESDNMEGYLLLKNISF